LIPSNIAKAQSLASCTTGNDYCDGYVNWPGSVTGDSTEVEVTFVTCGTCSGHVSNETWITDNNCGCWVEGGYSTYGPNNGDNKWSCSKNNAVNCYFWADMRPNGGGYNEHAIENIPSGDYGGYETVEIYFNGTQRDYCNQHWEYNLDWRIDITSASGKPFDQDSTCNSMSPASIQTGEELENSGAASPSTLFIDNRWQNLPRHNWTYQGVNGTNNLSDDPPYAYWDLPPSESSTGGVWVACTSGC